MSDIVKVKYSIQTNRVGSECAEVLEFEREDWEGMTEDEQESEMRNAAFGEMEWYYEVLTDKEAEES
jgi:hypothetical protein